MYCAVLLLSPLCVLLSSQGVLAAPQQVIGFGNASPDEIAQIRAGTYGEMFDDAPVYNYNYKVADTSAQNYIAMDENRDGDQVTGSYQYVDPYGSLIIVTYTAGPMGYSETREVREGAIEIKPQPTKKPTQNNQFSGSSANFGSISGSTGFGSSSGSSSFGSSSGSSSFGSSSGSSGFGSSGFGSSSLGANSGTSNLGFNSGSSSSGSSFSGSSQSSSSESSSGSTFSVQSTAEQQSSGFNTNNLVSSVVSQIQPLISGAVSNAFTTQEVPISQVVIPAGALPLITPPATRNIPISNKIVNQVVSEISPLVSRTVTTAVANSKNRDAGISSNQATGSRFQTGGRNSGFRRTSNFVPLQAVPSPAVSSQSVASPTAFGQARSSSADITAVNLSGQISQQPKTVGSIEDIFGNSRQSNVRVSTPYFRIEY